MLTTKVLLLTGAIATIGANSLMLSPLAGAVADSFSGRQPADIMLAAAAYGLAVAISALTLAPMADRLGAGRVLAVAMATLAMAFASSAAAPDLPVLIAAQALAGLAAGAALPSIYSLTAWVAAKGRESETLGVVLTGWTISMVLGVGLAALGAEWLHWRAVFLGLGMAAACITWRLLGWRDNGPTRQVASSPLTALRVPGIGRMLAICAAYMIAFYGSYTYLGAHLIDVLGRSTLSAGMASVAYGIGFGVAVPLDRLIDRFGDRAMSPPVFGALAITYTALALFAGHYGAILGLCLVWGLLNHLGLNLIVKQLTALDVAQRGAVMGLYSAATYLCVMLAALLYRPVFDAYGLTLCAALSALGVALALAGSLQRRTA